jgi:hypothetical protein
MGVILELTKQYKFAVVCAMNEASSFQASSDDSVSLSPRRDLS